MEHLFSVLCTSLSAAEDPCPRTLYYRYTQGMKRTTWYSQTFSLLALNQIQALIHLVNKCLSNAFLMPRERLKDTG